MPLYKILCHLALMLILGHTCVLNAASKEPANTLNIKQLIDNQSANPSLNKRNASTNAVGTTFKTIRKYTDKSGTTREHFYQYFDNTPVFGQKVIVHHRPNGITKASGFWIKDLEKSNTLKVIQASSNTIDPVKIAMADRKHEAGWLIKNLSSKLYIFLKDNGVPVYAYFVQFNATPLSANQTLKPQRPSYIIDASTGEIIRYWDNIQHNTPATATGPGGNDKTGKYEYGVDYESLDITQSGDNCIMENTNVKTVNLNHQTGSIGNPPFIFPCSRNDFKTINGAYSPINDAHFFGNVVFNMFQDWLGEPPLTFQLTMRVHYDNNYENAFWDGSTMTFGDGGSFFYPLVDINVSAHEVAHGYTEQNSGLIYSNQSGGINESFSDIAGEAAEYYLRGNVDWLVGADIMKEWEALRYFEQPSLDGASIDHADEYWDGIDVHYSSGVFNRAFFLIAAHPDFTVRTAFEVFAHANKHYWVADETFDNAACGVQESAVELGYNFMAIYDAFSIVGVDCGYLPFIDSDGDQMDDNWERLFGLNPTDASDAENDIDEDALTNLQEYMNDTSPLNTDSDNDGLNDGDEITLYLTNPSNDDTDTDKMPDGYEVAYSFNPLAHEDAHLDADNDGKTNQEEYLAGTHPRNASSTPTGDNIYINFEEGELNEQWSTPDFSDQNWSIVSGESVSGVNSLAPGSITDNQQSIIGFSRRLVDGLISFKVKTSTESNYDFFEAYFNGERIHLLSGINDWQLLEIPITASGLQTLAFVYRKDGSVSSGEDKVWLDDLAITGQQSTNSDRDSDGMDTDWEIIHELNPDDSSDAVLDNDSDGLTNLDEFHSGTNPHLFDTDFDGLSDYQEVNESNTNPTEHDTDFDGLLDGEEVNDYFTDPLNVDTDSDGLTDRAEVKQHGTNPLHQDTDSDGLSDAEEVQRYFTNPLHADTDNDGLIDGDEVNLHSTDPLNADTDGDGLTDTDEVDNNLDPLNTDDAVLDYDNDGLSNAEEIALGTDLLLEDSDNDGLNDAEEVNIYQTNPLSNDTDNDGVDDSAELHIHQTNPLSIDTDTDTLSDYDELFIHLTNPLSKDSDNDSLEDAEELNTFMTNPLSNDTDSDGLSDSDEIYIHLTNPSSNDTDIDGLPDAWEISFALNALDPSDALLDIDLDALTALEEFNLGTHPKLLDTDYDGLTDSQEVNILLTNPLLKDTDLDNIPDGWEVAHELNPSDSTDGTLDNDEDSLSNLEEFFHATNPNNSDTDNDGLTDSSELTTYQTNPLIKDTDADGMPDGWEIDNGFSATDLADAAYDKDSDLLTNLQEFESGTDPSKKDTDADGLTDGEEVLNIKSNPLSPDTDGDGINDGQDDQPLTQNNDDGDDGSGSIPLYLLALLTLLLFRNRR